MSGVLFEAAAAADMIEPSQELSLVMLRQHLQQAMTIADDLDLKMASHDICQILKWLDA